MRVVSISCFLLIGHAIACSYVEVPVHDSSAPNQTKFVIARSNELGNELGVTDYEIRVHPRGEGGGRYGFVSVGLHEATYPIRRLWVVLDGINEMGFTGGVQTLRESKYEDVSVKDAEMDVVAQFVLGELLRKAANVDEALAWMASHRVVGPSGVTGIHWALADASGRSVVVEYLRGQRIVYENSPRVMTNDPPLDWHWRNLNSYVNLQFGVPTQNDFLAVETTAGSVPSVSGHGANLLGLPGDSTAASRYALLFYLRGYAVKGNPPKSTDDGIVLATALLNKVFIPVGTVAHQKSVIDRPEYTPFNVIKVPAERRLLVRGYRNLRWREIDLSRVDFTKGRSWPLEDGSLGIEDLLGQNVRNEPVAV